MAECSFRVEPAESGQKLLQCLARRVNVSQTVLHKWIRTGQVRVNKGRRKPFDRLEEGDEVRLPPFAQEEFRTESPPAALDLPIVWESDELLVINKPAGLPTQPGTGHEDSVCSRLAAAFPVSRYGFTPTPAHRLDRDTSGLLLVARSYTTLRSLCDAFAARTAIQKEYLAWSAGTWPHDTTIRLVDTLGKGTDASFPGERMEQDDTGKKAELDVTPLLHRNGATLLRLSLLTGRTHQIRVQLALRKHPVLGDAKYGGRRAFPKPTPTAMFLHAYRLCLNGQVFTAPPAWPHPWHCPRIAP